LAIKA